MTCMDLWQLDAREQGAAGEKRLKALQGYATASVANCNCTKEDSRELLRKYPSGIEDRRRLLMPSHSLACPLFESATCPVVAPERPAASAKATVHLVCCCHPSRPKDEISARELRGWLQEEESETPRPRLRMILEIEEVTPEPGQRGTNCGVFERVAVFHSTK